MGFTGWVAVLTPGDNPAKYYGRVLGKRLIFLFLATGFIIFQFCFPFEEVEKREKQQ